MKKSLTLLVFILAISFVACARVTYELSVNGALAKVKFKVVDQEGVVVSGVKIWGGFSASRSRDSILVDGVTNTNGEFVAQGKCNEFLRVDVTKEGYYHTEEEINFWSSKADPIVVDGKWQPYGETRTVVLKKIRNPWAVKVFNDQCHCRVIPVFGQWIGFDLENGDWTPPHGAGRFEDVLLRFRADVRKHRIDYAYTMDVSFTNNPYAGAYPKRKDCRSDLMSEYVADTNASYLTEFSFSTDSVADKRVKSDYLDQDSYLVFRTRTRVDKERRLVGAHYGKIYGIWRSTHQKMYLNDGCFNPVENDNNIEGDKTLLYKVRNCNSRKIEIQ